MNDKIEKKEWWSFLSIAAYFAWALIMAVNAMNYKEADSITYVMMCAAELLAFLSSIGAGFMRQVAMEEPIGEMEPEKMEKRRKRIKRSTAIWALLAVAVFFGRAITGKFFLFK